MDLKDKVVFVSGSSRGIGKEIALKFAKEGSNVILNARKEISKQLVDEIESYGVKALVVLGDIANSSDVKRMLKEAYDNFERIDVLVNNAGITKDMLINGMKLTDFKDVIDVNLTGTFQMTQAFLKKMYKKRFGSIINVSSVVGLHGNIGQVNYAASKAGVIGLTKSVAREAALRNVRCNAIAPGMVISDMTDALSEKVKEKILDDIPLKRFGNAYEIAETAVFLAKNEYITGQVITVDGGMTI